VFSVDRLDDRECHWRDLYTVGADGSGLELLIRRGDAAECEPGHRLAVLRPGKRPRRLASGSDPSWAPGGRAVAFVGAGGVRRKSVGARGPGPQLVHRPLLTWEPTWSPDGRSILYRAGTRLKRVAARTGRPLPLGFDAPGTDFQSSWQAR
jgi:hypothetical protein